MSHQRTIPRRSVLGMALALPAMLVVRHGAASEGGLLGTWRGMQGAVTCDLALMAGGRFSRQDCDPGGAGSWIAGRWRVVEALETLRLDIQEWAPRELCDPLGCSPVRMAAETYRYAFPAPETLLLQDGIGRYAYRRIG